jgi:hypothetical protein
MNVSRQPSAAVSLPPKAKPSMPPSGSDKPHTAIARARRWRGKKSEIIEWVEGTHPASPTATPIRQPSRVR